MITSIPNLKNPVASYSAELLERIYLEGSKLSLLMLLAGLLFFTNVSAQQALPQANKKQFSGLEDSLKVFSDSMINALSPITRFRADSNFVRGLVRALKVKNSFYYPFDSLESISRLYAPDSAFRIFTWQLKKDEYVFLQKGAIQIRTPDGSLKLFPLFDYSMYSAKPQDSVRSNNNWIGAIYYKVV
ncbi:MAG: hypothetical protein ABI687_10890, partial [Flavitalea sp.]